jgi:hypothetical protein
MQTVPVPKALLAVLLFFSYWCSSPLSAQDYVSKQDGNWTSGNTWNMVNTCSENRPDAYPAFSKGSGCPVNIVIKHHLNHSDNVDNFGNGQVNGLEMAPGASLTVNGDFSLPGSGWGSVPYFILGEGAKLNVSGTFKFGRRIHLVIPKNTTVTVGNLIVDHNSPIITVEEGAELIVLNSTTIVSNSTLNVRGKFTTKRLVVNSGILNSDNSGIVQVENDLTLNSGTVVFSGNSELHVGGKLQTSGSASVTVTGDATVKIKDDITLIEGVSINLKEKGFLSSGGDLRLDGGAKFNLSDASEGLIEGDVYLNWNLGNPNGDITTMDSAELYVTGKLVAGRTDQVEARAESKIYICDYPNSTQLGSPFIFMQPNAYYGPGCEKLPVEWLGVNVQNADVGKNILEWSTAKEWENSHFEIERSTNGVDQFTKIAEVTGMGWTSSVTDYSFEDKDLPPIAGIVYYRIKQVDFNGVFNYSETVGVKLDGNSQADGVWKVYPNPSSGDQIKLVHSDDFSFQEITMRLISPAFPSEPVTVHYGYELDQEVSKALLKTPKGIAIIELVWGETVNHVKVVRH